MLILSKYEGVTLALRPTQIGIDARIKSGHDDFLD